ncbi:AAA family ATPase [Bacillus thuringiensis]|uniref:AAA family ATPase n=1 Tax=Bacillus thuringiensis TaxID=1428 RepID=UPI0016425061|nr:DUF3696 domain-containing protein [Bacillus thuringiensis]
MIKSIGLKNFKAFNQFNEINFKKINLFLGPNSSGKSSYLKALLTLRNTVKSNEEEPALNLTDEIGDFKSIVYAKKQNEKITFVVELANKEENSEKLQKIIYNEKNPFIIMSSLKLLNLKKINIDSFIKFTNDKHKIYKNNSVEKFSFSIKQTPKKPNVVSDFIMHFANGDICKINMQRNSYYITYNEYELGQPNLVNPYKFLFKLNEEKVLFCEDKDLEILMNIQFALKDIEIRINTFFEDMIHTEPFRNKPERAQLIANFKFNTVGSKGENTTSTVLGLLENQNLKDSKGKQINSWLEEINHWLDEFDLAQSVGVEELKNNNYSLIIKNKFTGIENNIVDVGVGTSQLLPIIIESVISLKNSMLLIEEPETHIHPNAQAKLGELFVSCAIKHQKRFIIETHSMYLVRQLQIMVAKKELSPDDIGVYYFNQSDKGTNIQEYKLMENGQFKENFPKGFFDVPHQLNKLFLEYM